MRWPRRRITVLAALSSAVLVAGPWLWPLHVPAVAAPALSIDGSVTTHQTSPSTTITSGAISTTKPGDVLLAFLASDGPGQAGGVSFSSVTGAGATWRLRQRANGQPGTAEIWQATAAAPLSNAAVTATRANGSYVGSIAVVAFAGADTAVDGAVAGGSAASGAPSVGLVTTRAGSWVWGVGADWDAASARTAGTGQAVFDEYRASVGDTYWVQNRVTPTAAAGTPVTIDDTAPTTDRWDLAVVEILPAPSDNVAPSTPAGLVATAPNSNEVDLSWTASIDDVGVVGYDVLRGATTVGTSATTTYRDLTVQPNTAYSYTVRAYDAAGNRSPASTPAPITTPPAATTLPVISNVAVTSISQTSVIVSWNTDIPADSQVLFGPTAAYTQQTTVDPRQLVEHSQALVGLTAGTTYHFAVRSTGAFANTSTSQDGTFATTPAAAGVTLPDMRIMVPTNAISVGSSGTTRQLQFTHITWDAGPGPFELDPTYDSASGVATFTQAIYRSTTPGNWTFDHRVPVATTGTFVPPDDYQFPLTRFTLNAANADGTPGAVVAASPKSDYCITGNVMVPGVPDTPSQSFIPAGNCANPNNPLGWSVGWGDQYDQTDAGQPIALTGVADGRYVLHAEVDPNHLLTEASVTNDTTDTLLQLTGTTVSVLSQTSPGTSPPVVTMTSPAPGASVSGTVALAASASAVAPATVASVQFLLDGQNLGAPVTAAPYTFNWTVGSTALGSHVLSARATDSAGVSATAPGVAVTVVSGPPPPDQSPPTVSITNPVNGQTVSGTIPVAATAMDDVAVASVQFVLDGQPLGVADTTAPYTVSWDTTASAGGLHALTATATDTSGKTGAATAVVVTVQNPPPPMTCFVMQAQVNVHGRGTVTTPAFSTALAGEVLVAFVAADGPAGAGRQSATITGAGLTWRLAKRANARSGDAEVWWAPAPAPLANVTVRSTLQVSAYSQSLTVIAMEGVSGIGASVAASAATGAPRLVLTTTAPTSLVFAVGADWDRAVARTLPAGWAMLDQWVNTAVGDTYWSQYTNTATGAAGSVITVGDTAPTNDSWNLVAVELLNTGG